VTSHLFVFVQCLSIYSLFLYSRSSEDDALDNIPLMHSSDEGTMEENESLFRRRRQRPYGQSRLSFWCSNFSDRFCKW